MNPDDDAAHWTRDILYRTAYGHAYRRLIEEGVQTYRADPATVFHRFVFQVLLDIGGDHQAREAIEEGVRDACEGRRPRW